MILPVRYQYMFKDIYIDGAASVMTAVGPRAILVARWVCKQCGKAIKPNNAGAQSHIAKHLRERS